MRADDASAQNDLVQRLRRDGAWLRSRFHGTTQGWVVAYVDLGYEAADEIEQLQADNINAGEVVHENEHLRAEVVRLQQALRQIAALDDRGSNIDIAVEVARALLEGNQQ